MPRLFLLAALLAAAAPASAQPDLSGDWSGPIQVGSVELVLILHLTPVDGGYAVTMDVPQQGAYGVPTDTATVEDGVFAFAAPALNAGYRGDLTAAADSIAGTWTQNGRDMPLAFARYEAPAEPAAAPKAGPKAARGDFSGAWVGTMPLPSGGEVRVTFLLARNDDGSYAVSVTPPGQTEARDIGQITVDGHALVIPILGQAEFSGTISDDEATAEGTMAQGGEKYPMTLVRR